LSSHDLAILWDMDGTLIDTKICHFQTWDQVFRNHGFSVDTKVYEANFGRNTQTILPIFLGFEPDPELMEQLIEEKEKLFRAAAPAETSLVPGVESWLATAHAKGIPQAIASSGSLENIETMISLFNLNPYFDKLISGADLPAKPKPDVFIKAAKVLGCPPEHCLVIEDSLPGVQAAKNAGMPCIAVTTTEPHKNLSLADFVVDDFISPLENVLLRLKLL